MEKYWGTYFCAFPGMTGGIAFRQYSSRQALLCFLQRAVTMAGSCGGVHKHV
jgi:hypothetical protein